MDVIWKQGRMRNLLQSFFMLAKVRVGFFDLEGNEILAFPLERADYCTIIRSSPEGDEACRRCDRDAIRKASRYNGPYIYQCHAYLTEALAPISSEKGRIAYLMIGQVRQSGNQDERRWDEIRREVGYFCSDMDGLKYAYSRLAVIKVDEIRACADVLQALANYVWLDNYIRIQNEPLSVRVKAYIADNISADLSLAALARQFGIGKTTLCGAVKRDYRLTVNQLIRSVRVERAEQLLQSGKQSIAQIAEAVGIGDYNYFSKVFKEETGLAPSVFRGLCEKEKTFNNA
ncbi:MAG: PocR ligand-binding domain-containing protein [Spirochaetaceae bacterium]|jgi:AraC-like DNA-binding protein|nr:PocR ligand-binding domain-containing protein [Spirochaetaceae bacterium]